MSVLARLYTTASIRIKLTIISLVTTGIVSLLVGTLLIVSVYYSHRETMLRDFKAHAAIIGENSAAALTFNDAKTGREILAALRASVDVRAAALYDGDKRLFASFERSGDVRVPSEFSILPDGYRFNHSALEVTAPIKFHTSEMGSIYLQVDLSSFYTDLRRFATITLLIVLGAFGISTLLLFRLQRAITAPLEELSSITQQVSAQQNYAVRANVHSHDEIGTLAGGINDMLAKIQKRDSELEQEIGERKQAEENLKKLNESLEDRVRERSRELEDERNFIAAVLDTESALVLVLDSEGRVLRVNRACEMASGFDGGKMLGKPIWELSAASEESEEARRVFTQVCADKLPGSFEAHWPRPDGERLTVAWTYSAVSLNEGAYIIATGNDITERKRSEDELRKLSRAVEQSPISIVITDGEGNIEYVNPRFAEVTGYSLNEVRGKNPRFLKSGANPPELYQQLWATILAGKVWKGEILNRRKNGELYWENVTICPIFDAAGVLTHFLGLKEDVTQTKKLLEEMIAARYAAEAANRIKSEFLANMSHEIRTPMNAILGMAEMLGETELTAEQRKYVSIFQNAGNNLLDLINDILDLSKVEAGQFGLDKQDFDLEWALQEQIQLLAPRAHGKGLELALDIQPDVPTFVNGDAKRLRQCVTNLVGNAIKFTQRGGVSIMVQRVADEPGKLMFSVEDTGIGIPADKQVAIFDAFTQADGSVTRKYGGTGLGLTITKRLVELMEGKVWVESEPDKGSVFHFTALLPEGQPVIRPAIACTDLSGARLLVVDDFPFNRAIVRQYLSALGAEVVEAESGADALEMLHRAHKQNQPFDLALIDCHMPVMDGIELAQRVRDSRSLRDTRLLMLSSDDAARASQRAQELGATLLMKPIKRHELIQMVTAELHLRPVPVVESLPEVKEGQAPTPALRPLNILLAEDNQDNVLLMQVMLKSTPHHLDVAENGKIAVEKFIEGHYDLILMDMQMPEMDGYAATETIRRIEQTERLAPTPVVALTAHALKEDEQKSLDAGCDRHLTKPIKKQLLLEVVNSYAMAGPAG
jgi:PAS domain S-box-containing protein